MAEWLEGFCVILDKIGFFILAGFGFRCGWLFADWVYNKRS